MSTAAKTSTSRTACVPRKKRGYTPGARVERRPCPGLPAELLDKILVCMADAHAGLSVIKLSMVNRAFRQGVNENLQVWHRLYLLWRGPINPIPRGVATPRGFVRLRPTLPTTLPNFRTKTPPTT